MGASTIKRLWTYSGFLLCLFLALAPGNAYALPYAEANFNIDWSTLQYNVIEGDLTITPLPNSDGMYDMHGSSSKAKVESDPDWADKTTLEDKIEAPDSTEAYMSNAFATSSTKSVIETMMSGKVNAYGGPGIKNKAESEAKQWEYFTVAGAGTLQLTIDYYLHQQIEVEATDGWATAKSEVKLELGKWWVEDDKIKKDDIKDEFKIEWKELSVTDEDEFWGTLNATYAFEDGDFGFMKMTAKNKAEAYAPPLPDASPVPEPATMLLFGSGLIGLAGFRRKIKK